MINMGYCRFENTYLALKECFEELCESSIEELEENANSTEKAYIRKLITLCEQISDNFGENEDD